MIWADKIPLGVFGVCLIGILALHGLSGETEPTTMTFPEALWLFIQAFALKVILPLWLFLRILDAIAGGPARRRGNIKATVIRDR